MRQVPLQPRFRTRRSSRTPHPIAMQLADMKGFSGRLASPTLGFRHAFPAACEHLHSETIAEIAALSRLVGMVCPGLHSLFTSFTVAIYESATVGWSCIPRHVGRRARRACQNKRGGLAKSSARWRLSTAIRRSSRPSMARIAGVVGQHEFAASVALIVGGSRGTRRSDGEGYRGRRWARRRDLCDRTRGRRARGRGD